MTISCRTAPRLTRWDFSHWSRSTSSTCAGSRSPVLWISPQTPLRRRPPPAGSDPSPPRCCCWPADPQYAIEVQGRGSPQGSGPCIRRARPEAGLSEPLPRVVPRRPLPSPETHIMAFTPRTWGHQHHRLAPRRQPPRRRSAEPRLERLEDRTVLSTLTVMNNADIGLGSLRAAIITANTNGDPTNTITFAPRLAGRTITLTSGELAITKSLDIEGPGADKLTISGNDASRVFEIGRRATVTLANLTIANGWTISNQVVSKRGKVVSGELGGGGILNDADATLNLTSCAVVNNQAIAGDKLDVFGGGLLNLGTATVTSSTFTGNKAMGGGNSSTIFTGSQGGGIDNFGGATLKVDYSTFINNQVIGADTLSGEDIAGANFGVGGAIENNAGFDVKHPHPSTATISNSTFTGNLATAGTDSTANGGAIGNEFSGATVTLINSTLTGNQAIGGLGSNKERSFVVSQGIGGGISNSGGSKLTVMNSTLSDNQAIAGDHSIPTSANPLTGAGIGGGIANFVSGELTVMNSTL